MCGSCTICAHRGDCAWRAKQMASANFDRVRRTWDAAVVLTHSRVNRTAHTTQERISCALRSTRLTRDTLGSGVAVPVSFCTFALSRLRGADAAGRVRRACFDAARHSVEVGRGNALRFRQGTWRAGRAERTCRCRSAVRSVESSLGLRQSIIFGRISAPFPLAVTYRLRLSALTAAIARPGVGSRR